MILYLDTETRSRCDLKTAGAYVYAYHSTTEVLLVSVAEDDGPPRIVPLAETQALIDAADTVVMHNSFFDRHVLEAKGVHTPTEKIHDTLVIAHTLGLPGGLQQLGVALRLDDDIAKIKEGKRLIRLFSLPQRKGEFVAPEDRPEDWELFIQYALRDVEVTRAVYQRLPHWNSRGAETLLWQLDQIINDRGLPVDLPLAKKAAQLCDDAAARLDAEMLDVTAGAVSSHAKRDQMLAWMATRGVDADGYTKADVTGLLKRTDLPADVRRALEIRKEAGRTSTAKYVRFGQMAHKGRIHGALQYAGAQRTMRWSGRGVQIQNLPRPKIDGVVAAEAILEGWADIVYDDVLEAASSTLRSVIRAGKGHKLIAGDYSNIEGRVLAWLAGEQWKLDAYIAGEDLYKLAYAKSFNVNVATVNSDQRFLGKVQELALGFGGSVGAFTGMAALYGKEIPEPRVREIVQAWRRANPRIVTFWYACEEAAKSALREPGKAFTAGPVQFKVVKDWLLCRLPSGRFVPYYKAKLTPDGVEYEGLELGKWTTVQTFGGKFAENITQAAARDVMAWNMPRVEAAGFRIIGTVHDEIITEPPDTDAFTARGLEQAMAGVPPWAEGLPIAVKAFETYRYRKD